MPWNEHTPSASQLTFANLWRRSGGVIGFDAFMGLALYSPGLGYYSAGAAKLGSSGDFITAPEVSSLFSRCLARQTADILRTTEGDILELGAGLGAMAADMLLELRRSSAARSVTGFSKSARISRSASGRASRNCPRSWRSGSSG